MKRQEDSSQYGGRPLIKPKQPYRINYEYRLGQVDSDTSFREKISIVREDFVEYIKDIIFLRGNAFIFKTAYFTKRNWKRLTTMISNVNNTFWHGMYHVGAGCRKIFMDGAWAVSTQK